LEIIPGGELRIDEYKLNNIILIVDVSSSMNRGGKFEALRGSFNTLVDALRRDDVISIISMSSNAELVQEPVGVYEKDSLKSRVARIKPLGGTNGGAAISLAYKLAEEHFIEGGNNQVIIATDGVFYGGALTRREIEELIGKGNIKGIHMSTVAFGSDPKAMMFLENLAQT
jgi:Ca-activated chloride channel family protein